MKLLLALTGLFYIASALLDPENALTRLAIGWTLICSAAIISAINEIRDELRRR
jgi:hypothetical protein